MRRATWGLAALAALLALVPAAAAAPPRPAQLEVQGGEGAWHANDRFTVSWTNPSTGGGPPIAAVHHQLRDPLGTVIGGARLGWVVDRISPLWVPRAPGAYGFEVWLEDAAGAQGEAAVATLRFDNRQPGDLGPLTVPAWVGRTDFPLTVKLGPPAGPPPLSGIRGYAAAIGPGPNPTPCAAAVCTEAETTLRGGGAADALRIGALPEGVSRLGAVAVSGSGVKSAATARATLTVDLTDPVTQLAGVPAGWANQPVTLTATATDAGSGMEPAGGGRQPVTAIRVGGGVPTIAPGARVVATVIEEGIHSVAHYARDLAGNVADGGHTNGHANRHPQTAEVRIDRTAPSASFAPQDPRDPELIRVRIADALSGPDPARGLVGVRRAGSNAPFAPLPAAPSAPGELRARWDSDSQPPGRYEFRAVAHDLAGNATVTERRANGAAMALTNPLKADTTLRSGFGGRVLVWHRCARRGDSRRCRRQAVADLGRRPLSRTVPYGRGTLLSGRLIAGRRTPLGGTPVRIVERFAGRPGPARVSTVRTGAGGEFSVRLAAGPSREVTAVFDGGPTLSRSAARPLRLAVRGRVRLGVSSRVATVGGAPLVFRGRVAARRGEIPPEGKSVQLQFRVAGLPWSEFRTVQTGRDGRFRYAYRFSDNDSRGARFQFRAKAPAQDGWPYEPASSRPLAVRGR